MINMNPAKFCLLILLTIASITHANTDLRRWELADGEKLYAELVSYDPESGVVHLKLDEKEDKKFQFDDFGTIDKAWLVEWSEFEQRLASQIKDMGGRFEHITTTGNHPTDLFVYYPSAALTTPSQFPALILFNAGGKAGRFLLRHIEAAEASSLILISMGQFRNTHEQADEDKLVQRWNEVFPQVLQEVEFNEEKLFMGGSSGGASRAFDFATQTDYAWAGIYSSGGWLGGRENYDRDYPDNMRVVMVNGNNDKAANSWVEPDSEILRKHNCEVVLISFEGGHQVPPTASQIKAFNWLLEREEFVAD